MPDEPVETHLAVDATPGIDSLLEQCLSVGLRSSSSDDEIAWTVTTEDGEESGLSTGGAATRLANAEWGWIDGWLRQVPVRLGIALDSRLVPADTTTVSVSTSELYLQPDSPNAADNVRQYLDLVAALYDTVEPWYGVGSYLHSGVGSESQQFDPEGVRSGVVEHLYWLNLYPSELVDWFGQSVLASAPTARTRDLPDGGVMVLSTLYPYEFGPLDNQSSNLAEHLRLTIQTS